MGTDQRWTGAAHRRRQHQRSFLCFSYFPDHPAGDGAGEIRQVASIGTDRLPAGEDEEALGQAVAAAREFNTLFA